MTVETEVSNLTTAVDGLTSAVNVSRATLDASVADAEAAQTGAQTARDTASAHKLAAEAAATSATSTASALTGFDLSAIDDTISDTAVDVFVYDTSKDSDGGAWRKRTQHTSWYNETLNTSIRGSRREFPSVAVIVAVSNKVTIYDGDDPDLPMWMVFMTGGEQSSPTGINALGGGSETSLAIAALNGIIFVGNNSGAQSAAALKWDFLTDLFSNYSSNTAWGGEAGNIANRGDVTAFTRALPAIVGSTVLDVAMTVLPNAPIDAATGLQVPTVALATGGGISVIKDDGTVVDITGFAQAPNNVSFDSENNLISESNYSSEFSVYAIPEADSTVDTFIRKYLSTANTNANNGLPKLLGNGGPYHKMGGASSTVSGLTLLDRDMGAYITSTYNTGWMNGDIKLATLSDTDDTDVVAETKINEAFATKPSWNTSGSGAGTWSANGTLSCSGATTFSNYFWKSFSVEAGKTYTATVKVAVRGNRGYLVKIGTTSTGGEVGILANSDGAGTHSLTFTATANDTYYYTFQEGVGSTANTWDDSTVRLAEEDRSVNGNGLQVFGTVTKTEVASGADLVGYSGFSASNYLEQPYNSDLDFGTGDCCGMAWFKQDATALTRTIFDRDSVATDKAISFEIQANTSYLQVSLDDGTDRVYVNSGSTVDDDSWHLGVWVRRGDTLEIYVDGVLKNTADASSVDSISSTDARLRVGDYRRSGVSLPFGGSLALLRISATAPSAEQIAKIYRDEKVLFQENAQATLYGSSDAVTALAYDDTTELLHVGTSAGRSVFQGLRRVENTTDAVGAAISASNNLVVEE